MAPLLAAALLALAGFASAADFSAVAPLPALDNCTSALAGTAPPQLDAARTNMTHDAIAVAAWSRPVSGRRVEVRLGNATRPECTAAASPNPDECRHEFNLAGSWRQLRTCGWSAPDTLRRPGYEVRNNTIYVEWQDEFSTGKRASRLVYPVSIALPTTVNVQTDVKVLEESGIKNFNLTGVTFDQSDGQRFLVADFQMYSRWPNNLTLSPTNLVTLPGYQGSAAVSSYQLPTCVKTDGSSSSRFDTEDFCWQFGQIRINIGTTCEVGGIYTFNFDTHCFPGAANTQDCTGKLLSANASVGTPDDTGSLKLNLCNTLFKTVASIQASMVADKPGTPVEPWIPCASEAQTCIFAGTKRIRYGDASTGRYGYVTQTGPAACTGAALGFGSFDPAPNVLKSCWYEAPQEDAAGAPVQTRTVTTGALPETLPGFSLGAANTLSEVEIVSATVGGGWVPVGDPMRAFPDTNPHPAGEVGYILAHVEPAEPYTNLVSVRVRLSAGKAEVYQTGQGYVSTPAGVKNNGELSGAEVVSLFKKRNVAPYNGINVATLTARISNVDPPPVLVAQENFDYPDGPVGNLKGGTGWLAGSGWFQFNPLLPDTFDVSAGRLVYPGGGGTLVRAGARRLASTIDGTNAKKAWVTFVAQFGQQTGEGTPGIRFTNGAENSLVVGNGNPGAYNWGIFGGGKMYLTTIAFNNQKFVLVEIDYGAGKTNLYVSDSAFDMDAPPTGGAAASITFAPAFDGFDIVVRELYVFDQLKVYVTKLPGAARRLRARQAAGGYFFGDTVTLTATLFSPELPIYESRLIKMTVGRNVVLRDPSPAGNGKFIRRFVTSGLVNSPGGPNAPGALSQLALNTNFTYYPGSTEVVMTLVPNMLPRDDPGADYSSLAFLTTDDFDSVSEYTFRATFRVYFDAASAAGQRRRRLYTRDTSFPASAVRQSGTADAGAISGMRIPRNASAPGAEEVIAAEPTNAPASAVGGQNVLLIAAVGVCSAALLASLCAGILACASMRRGRDRRAQGGYKELVDGANGKVAPEWPSKWGV